MGDAAGEPRPGRVTRLVARDCPRLWIVRVLADPVHGVAVVGSCYREKLSLDERDVFRAAGSQVRQDLTLPLGLIAEFDGQEGSHGLIEREERVELAGAVR